MSSPIPLQSIVYTSLTVSIFLQLESLDLNVCNTNVYPSFVLLNLYIRSLPSCVKQPCLNNCLFNENPRVSEYIILPSVSLP